MNKGPFKNQLIVNKYVLILILILIPILILILIRSAFTKS